MGSCYRWSQIHSTVQREAEPCYNLGWHRQATRATVGKAIEGSFPALLLRDKWRPERWFLKYTRGSQVETEQSLQQEEELQAVTQWQGQGPALSTLSPPLPEGCQVQLQGLPTPPTKALRVLRTHQLWEPKGLSCSHTYANDASHRWGNGTEIPEGGRRAPNSTGSKLRSMAGGLCRRNLGKCGF